MDFADIGKWLLITGIGLALLGGLLWALGRVPGLGGLGRLPGDINVQVGNVSCVAPIVTMLIISVVLTIVLNVLLRLFQKYAPAMHTSDFDYHLPAELIAQTPAEPRDSSRLLVLPRAGGPLEHRRFTDLLGYLQAGDLLVANESR